MKKMSDKESKYALIEMLRDFHAFCEENQILYFVGYGTLLGTIRHKGFIPWDDDLDVIILRRDYIKLVDIFNERQSPFRLKNIDTDRRYPYTFAKIYDSRTKLIENLYHDYDMGVYIDVFPMDYWPKDDNLLKKIQRLQRITKIKSYKIGKEQGFKKSVALLLFKCLLSGITLKNLIYNIDDLVEHSEKDELYIGNISGNVYGIKERLKTEWFRDYIIMEFENIKVNVPVHFDEVLTQLYGEYMTLPPVEKRVTHHSNSAYFR